MILLQFCDEGQDGVVHALPLALEWCLKEGDPFSDPVVRLWPLVQGVGDLECKVAVALLAALAGVFVVGQQVAHLSHDASLLICLARRSLHL